MIIQTLLEKKIFFLLKIKVIVVILKIFKQKFLYSHRELLKYFTSKKYFHGYSIDTFDIFFKK